MSFLRKAEEMRQELVANRRILHQCPELGFDLRETVAFVKERLMEYGCDNVADCAGGVTATIGVGGDAILLRADMDALPMAEESGLDFASASGRAHSCGHDMHTAMLLGAAKLLTQTPPKGTVKLLFQPAEESAEGARAVIGAGVMQSPRVAAALGLHVALPAPTGLVAYGTGYRGYSFDRFRVTITGKAGHGAAPHKTVDPIITAAHIQSALLELVSRECSPEQAAVCTIGRISAGDSANSIPQTAVMEGTIRAYEPSVREHMTQRLSEICTHIAKAFRAQADVTYLAELPAVHNDAALTARMGAYAIELLGQEWAKETHERLGASDDFALFSQQVPSVFFTIGAGSEAEGYKYGTHNPRAMFNEDILPIGSALLAHCASRWLCGQGGK